MRVQVPKMLKGHRVNLEIAEKGDLLPIEDWANDVDFMGDFEPFEQVPLGN